VDGPGGNNDYIWARGFRNPFTFGFQPETGALWVNCVGTAYEQIFLVNAGDHAGWNDYENNQPAGYIKPRIKYRTNGTDTRNIAGGTGAVRSNNAVTFTTTATHGFRQGEKITIAGMADSSFNGAFYVVSVPGDPTFTVAQAGPYATSGGGTATTLNQGGCVTGGCFYNSTGVPAAYRQNYFYGDFNSGRVMRAVLNSSNQVTSVDYFVTDSPNQIDVAVGPDGALYYVNHGGTVFRLAYTNIASQQIIVTPTVVQMVENGAAVLTVRLAMPPPGTVQVNVARTSGDPAISVAGGATLTFGPGDWSVPQVVRLQAAPDQDSTNGAAGLTVSAAGLSSETVSVRVLDLFSPFSVEMGAGPAPFQVRLNGEAGKTYVLERNASPTPPWTPFSTNTLTGASTNVTDPDSTVLPQRFYRARLVQ
jgi:hypothetical protein